LSSRKKKREEFQVDPALFRIWLDNLYKYYGDREVESARIELNYRRGPFGRKGTYINFSTFGSGIKGETHE